VHKTTNPHPFLLAHFEQNRNATTHKSPINNFVLKWKRVSDKFFTMLIVDTGKLTLLHFNDAYQIDENHKEPVGGAARFRTAIKQYENPLVFFGGDLFNPSLCMFTLSFHDN
jgi:hypothetical protein